jgi:hypothetical protein
MTRPGTATRTHARSVDRTSRWIVIAAAAAAIASMAMPAAAEAPSPDEIIGYVKTAVPDAQVVAGMNAGSAAASVKAVPGTPIRRGNSLRTGPAGSMGVTFKDNTIISIGPDTEVSVDDYLYEPSKGDLKLGASIGKGTMQYVSGVIAKLKPEAVAIKTPTGTIGVRGTKFVVKVEPTL